MPTLEGDLLARARREAGLSQRRLAQLAGTSQATVARIEAGRQSPSIGTLRRLVAACGARLNVQVDGYVGLGLGEPAPAPAPRSTPEMAPAGGRYLIVTTGDDALLIVIESVREVLPARQPRRLPGQPPGMAGVIAHRGAPLPCVDLAERLGLPGGAAGAIVVLDTTAGPVGALVSGTDAVLDLTSDAISTIPRGWTRSELVRGLAETPRGLVPVLDARRLRLDAGGQAHSFATHSR